MKTEVDYIIVGLGLAGACLAVQLVNRGQRIAVFDQPDQNRASSIAAGIFNPITGKRIVKTWKADEIFSYLRQFYSATEEMLGRKFFHPKELYTPFRSIEEQNEWMAKSSDPIFSDYVLNVTTKSTYGDQVVDPLGGILLNNCGSVNTKSFIEGVRSWIVEHQLYFGNAFDLRLLNIENETISYQNLSAQKIILCTGIHQLKSDLFEGLPLVPLKGEVITINTKAPLNRIYNRGVYIIESGEMEYKVGATYDLKNLSAGITLKGKTELEEKLNDFLKLEFKVTHQDWGIRPSTTDRRPLIGRHPKHKNIIIFNGLGTKGVSLAPYFSDQLTKYLLEGSKLDKEVNISRVKALYSGFD